MTRGGVEVGEVMNAACVGKNREDVSAREGVGEPSRRATATSETILGGGAIIRRDQQALLSSRLNTQKSEVDRGV